jgi:hypothetical protein
VKIHAVGRVTRRDQQDFHAAARPPLYIVDHGEAAAVAQAMVKPGRRIFLVKLDCGEWSEIAS